jgi:cell fate regulator YaaT (PSP1 superfamily)
MWAVVQEEIAAVLSQQGNYPREEEVLRKVVELRTRKFGAQERETLEVRARLAAAKSHLTRYAEAEADFRELIKVYASEFKLKVEMRQIGARQEAGKVGGIGSCGRELCCATWLTDFKSVNTAAARYQNLSINQTKLSGQCGRLKCCLNYELDTYLDALQQFPDNCDILQVTKGNAILIKKDIFKNLMWYTLPDSSKQYPVTIEGVRKIKSQNQQGIIPDVLETVELTSSKPKEVEPEFVDVVGQTSLRSLDKSADKKRAQKRQQQQQQGQGQRPQQRQQGNQSRNQQQQRGQGQRPQQNQPGQQRNQPPQKGQQQNPNRNRPNPNQPRPPRPDDRDKK